MQIIKYGCLLFAFIAWSVPDTNAQNFIGMNKDEIGVEIKKSYPGLKLNTSFVNPYYKYLKYEDKINEITVLFFLSEKDECTLVRKMCDYSNINDEIEELNKKYQPIGKNKWKYIHQGKDYSVKLEEGDWYFTVTTKIMN